MFRVRVLSLALCLVMVLGLCVQVQAVEVDCDAVYCFGAGDFAQTEEPLAGICITGLPDPTDGTVMLGNRVVRRGDILAADQLEQLTFQPLQTETDGQAQVCYLPIYRDRVEQTATMTISIRGKKEMPPVAEDFAVETYKNLPIRGKLRVSDPEEQTMTYTLIRQPKRGQVELHQDGTFTYTPKKNKVGVDSFVYTATDETGLVSRQATVTVQVLKPSDSKLYQDTVGTDYRFQAEWLRHSGLFTGETVGDQLCFMPEQTVSRGEFLVMAVKALEVPLTQTDYDSLPQDTPQWLKPYLAAANRAGLTAGLPLEEDSFGADSAITGGEAAVILQNALDLTISQDALETWAMEEEIPQWASASVAVMSAYEMALTWDQPMTRAQTAVMLYEASRLAITAPGTAVFRLEN